MKVALAVPNISADACANHELVQRMITESSRNGAELILFPEAVFSGLTNNDVYAHDIELAMSVDDTRIEKLCETARDEKMWVCFGFLENYEGCIYDSALLVSPAGEKVIHYRRINPQWRARNLPSEQYAEGKMIPTAVTPLGKTAILICGDLFDADVIFLLRQEKPQLLLFPFARCFPDDIKNEQAEWDTVEIHAYAAQVKLTTADLTMMTNYLADRSLDGGAFGGAFVMDRHGTVLASLPLRQEGILYFDVADESQHIM